MAFDPIIDNPEYLFKKQEEKVNKFRKGILSEEQFLIDLFKERSSIKMTFLIKDPDLLRDLLKKLTVKGRKYFLFRLYNFAIKRTAKLLGYSEKKITNYHKIGSDQSLIYLMAIIHRVPPHWLENEVIIDEWIISHFDYIATRNNIVDFIDEIIGLISKNEYCIKVAIIERDSIIFYLRVEIEHGAMHIEVFNHNLHHIDLFWLLRYLETKFIVKIGYNQTIIPLQKNPFFICTIGKKEGLKPDEFKPL